MTVMRVMTAISGSKAGQDDRQGGNDDHLNFKSTPNSPSSSISKDPPQDREVPRWVQKRSPSTIKVS
ncbi:hypothetical protein [Bacillus sp. S/N-304-OC-R1]|uniref:hypothetical protein n=1 Tax=Bacillus sp. S/N-304-OC-R1 TaxID=2758034 RepID=UPI001C8DA006|nr:hypothetical protein [Bacillus sp. S/N-304-OC-R1]MBY0121369.1 hypothetical protein [Bacillus sp. S/N-304-OC-R1]